MPKLRRFGGMEIPAADENTTFPCRLISPDFGTSRPAMERSVVVFPQPLGPSSVKSLPSGTSNETSWVARTAWPRSPGYSVHSDLTISTTWSVSRVRLTLQVSLPSPDLIRGLTGQSSIPGWWLLDRPVEPGDDSLELAKRIGKCARPSHSGTRDAEPPGGKSLDQDEAQQRRYQHHAERRKLHILSILPIFPDHDRQDFRSRAVEKNGAGKLAYGDDHHIDPPGNQPGLEQWQHDPPERHAPRRAAHDRRLLQLLVQRQHGGWVVGHPVGHESRDVGD